MEILNRISEALVMGDDEEVGEFTAQAIAAGIRPGRILDEALISAMDLIGKQFKAHEIFLPDVLLAAQAMHAGLEKLKPLLLTEGIPSIGTVVIGSVKGDLHDIGKNLVGIMLKGAGIEVIDLGNDVAPDAFLRAAQEHDADVVGMSALLTTTMPMMKNVVDLLKEQALPKRVRTIVGGAPVSEQFAREIGADAYAFDAASAVERVKLLLDG